MSDNSWMDVIPLVDLINVVEDSINYVLYFLLNLRFNFAGQVVSAWILLVAFFVIEVIINALMAGEHPNDD